MLGLNHRLVIDNGSCSFQERNGSKVTVNGLVSWSRPVAKVDPVVLDMLGEYVGKTLGCAIEVERKDRRFVYIFRSQPKFTVRDEALELVISLAAVNIKLGYAGLPTVMRLPPLLNADGIAMISWILKALNGKELNFESSDGELSWRPPPKKEGYAPLTAPLGNGSYLDRVMGPPSPPKKK